MGAQCGVDAAAGVSAATVAINPEPDWGVWRCLERRYHTVGRRILDIITDVKPNLWFWRAPAVTSLKGLFLPITVRLEMVVHLKILKIYLGADSVWVPRQPRLAVSGQCEPGQEHSPGRARETTKQPAPIVDPTR